MLDFPLVGSFQLPLAIYPCDDPAREAWERVGRFGTNERIARLAPTSNRSVDWNACTKYASVRIGQALEFREASLRGSLLSAPLPLYYAFLSALRGLLALGPEIMPRNTHGLSFNVQASLIESQAVLKNGTFTDYLDAYGIPWSKGDSISLSEALGHVVELANDLNEMDSSSGRVQMIRVQATTNRVRLAFPGYPRDFAREWRRDFPSLANVCEQADNDLLEVLPNQAVRSDPAIRHFLSLRLLPQLNNSWHPVWYSYRALDGGLKLDRAAYYFVAMFILGSAVRYEPELVMSVSRSGSEVGWLLKRFVSLADRHFPQLLLWSLYGGSQIYFGNP